MRAREQRQPWQRSQQEGAQEGGQGSDGGDTSFANFLTTWGAVPVGPTAFFKLLRNGECCLLYPGGAAEVRSTKVTLLLALCM